MKRYSTQAIKRRRNESMTVKSNARAFKIGVFKITDNKWIVRHWDNIRKFHTVGQYETEQEAIEVYCNLTNKAQ